MRVSASIVIYNEKKETLARVLKSFLLLNLEKELIIVDNSSFPILKSFCEGFKNTKYIFSNKNLGFGKAHNIAFKKLTYSSDIHIIINPDTYFDISIQNFIKWIYSSENISLAIPNICNTDESKQYVVRNIPTPLTLFKRRCNIFGIFNDFIKEDEYRDIDFKDISNIPFAHGCFLVFKTDIFKKLKGFDERFFMYMEDVDIFIRAKKYGKTVINPNYKIYHEYRKGSSKSLKLLYYHIVSAFKFFMKHRKLHYD